MKLPEWAKWLARDRDGVLYAFENKPIKSDIAWHIKDDDDDYRIMIETDDTFSHIKWTDEEPTEVKKIYEVSVHGCDDSTTIKQELTFEEYELLKEISEKITNTSSYVCMPTMVIEEVTE